jgi:hypothetical protein
MTCLTDLMLAGRAKLQMSLLRTSPSRAWHTCGENGTRLRTAY